MPQTLCFYHAPCNDGSAAAAALAYRLNRGIPADSVIEAIPTTFGRTWETPFDEDFLDILEHHDEQVATIYIVDISLSRTRFDQVLSRLESAGRIVDGRPRVVCIDHHQSAIDRLAEIDEYCDETYIRIGPGLSGATLVWSYFDEQTDRLEVPELLRYVADQDVWEWKLEGSRQVNAALNTLSGYAPDMIDELARCVADPDAWRSRRFDQGSSILSVIDAQVDKASGEVARLPLADGGNLLVVNATSNSSELGNRICEDAEDAPQSVAAIYALRSDWSVKVSLRSISGGVVNARMIAERFGGGGHDNAAGCRFPTFEAFREGFGQLRTESLL